MGLFSRNKPAAATGSRGRSSISSEAQAAELRSRARRRLIGALALVLAAIIVVPALFDSTPSDELAQDTLVVVPAVIPPVTVVDPEVPMTELAGVVSGPVNDAALEPEPATPVAAQSIQPAAEPEPVQSVPAAQAEVKPEPKPVETAPKPAEKPRPTRTDDGSVAIALLEGRAPAQAAPSASASGSFTLQIAAYTTSKDARSRRDQLISAGVTNTYVEHATVNSKDTYRLRVGPFPSRDAAQAAQARLRALGYDNSFISAK